MALMREPGRPGRGRGIVLVEAALIVPLLMLLLIGSIQYGWCFLKVQQVGQAARQGVRAGATQTGTNTKLNDAIAATMEAAGLSYAESGYTTTLWNVTQGTTVNDVSDPAQLGVGELLEVKVTIPDYSVIGVINAPLVVMPASISGSATMAKEGPL